MKIRNKFSYITTIFTEVICVPGNYYPPFSLRVSEELIEKVKYIAAKNKRSANKEIEYILEKAVDNYEKENGKIITKEP